MTHDDEIQDAERLTDMGYRDGVEGMKL